MFRCIVAGMQTCLQWLLMCHPQDKEMVFLGFIVFIVFVRNVAGVAGYPSGPYSPNQAAQPSQESGPHEQTQRHGHHHMSMHTHTPGHAVQQLQQHQDQLPDADQTPGGSNDYSGKMSMHGLLLLDLQVAF